MGSDWSTAEAVNQNGLIFGIELCRQLGFDIANDPDDTAIRVVTLPVEPV